MLVIYLPETEKEEAAKIHLEHSLTSVSKWEQTYERPFFGPEEKTQEESLAYIGHMIQNVMDPGPYLERFDVDTFVAINAYINAQGHGTKFRPEPPGPPGEILSAELIYHLMIEFELPFIPCESWHLGKLMALIKVRAIKKTKPKKMTAAERNAEFARINAERRAATGSSG